MASWRLAATDSLGSSMRGEGRWCGLELLQGLQTMREWINRFPPPRHRCALGVARCTSGIMYYRGLHARLAVCRAADVAAALDEAGDAWCLGPPEHRLSLVGRSSESGLLRLSVVTMRWARALAVSCLFLHERLPGGRALDHLGS